MSRPKKEESKNRRITIRLTDLEYGLFREASEKEKMSIAEYVRHRAICGKTETHYDLHVGNEEIKNTCEELHKIGINLNQISRFLNSGGTLTDEIRKEIRRAISELFTLRQELSDYISLQRSK